MIAELLVFAAIIAAGAVFFVAVRWAADWWKHG